MLSMGLDCVGMLSSAVCATVLSLIWSAILDVNTVYLNFYFFCSYLDEDKDERAILGSSASQRRS